VVAGRGKSPKHQNRQEVKGELLLLQADPRPAGIPVVLITGDHPREIDWHTRVAVAAVLPKPLDLRALEQAVDHAVGGRGRGEVARVAD
jgi:AmiR/NasT family two-component response regulator